MSGRWKVGDRIEERWEVMKILGGKGKSGMGIVYIVQDHEWNRLFAIKTFQEEVVRTSPATALRFVNEAAVWVQLDPHPHITEAEFLRMIEGRPMLFLEYVAGGDLGAWIRARRLRGNEAEVLRLGLEFCDGMDHAVSGGIRAHRDIKPANCLMTREGSLKITDFGLAKVLGADEPEMDGESGPVSSSGSARMTMTGAGFGTLPYMPPEQFHDARGVDVRADVYAFGVTLFEMLSGRLPFHPDTAPEFERMHREEPVPGLQECSDALNELIGRCMAKDPGGRFAGFGGELRERLADLYRQATNGQAAHAPVKGSELSEATIRNRAASFNSLGDAYQALGQGEEALAFFQKSLAIAEKLAAAEPGRSDLARDLSVSFNKLGDLYQALGQGEEALAFFQKSLAIAEKLAAAEPGRSDLARDLSVSFNKLGDLSQALGQGEEALAFFQKSLAIREKLAAAEPGRSDLARDLSVSFNKLGDLYKALGQGEEALAFFQKSLAIREKLAAAEPGRSDLARDLSVSFNKLGDLYKALGQGEEALAFFQKSLAIAEKLAAAEPGRSDLARDLSVSFNKLGDLSQALGQGEEALAFFQKSLAIAEKLAAAEPGRSDLARDLSVSYERLGDLYKALGQGEEALAFFQKSLAIAEKLAAAEPGRSDLARDLSVSFNKLGDLYQALGQGEEALAFFQKSLAIREKLAAAEPGRSDLARDLVVSCLKLSQFEDVPPAQSSWMRRAYEILLQLEAEHRLPDKQIADFLEQLKGAMEE